MDDEQIRLPGEYIELAEEENENYLTLTNLVCYLDYPNANKVQMDYGETEEEQAATLERTKTLTLMPVYAKCARGLHGKPTFKGHEVHKDEKTGELTFDTVPIGVHYDVYIKSQKVKTADKKEKVLPCVFAQQRIWKRNKNAVAAIRRLFKEGKLHSSWEVSVSEYIYKQGVKHLSDYAYQGNTFIGWEYAKPAYGQNAEVVSVATENEIDCELMIAEALAQDLLEQKENEVNEEVSKKENTTEEIKVEVNDEVAAEEVVTEVENKDENPQTAETPADENVEVSEAKEEAEPDKDEATDTAEETEQENSEESDTETSALTDRDLRRKLEEAYTKEAEENKDFSYAYISFLFPADNVAWFHSYRMLETQFKQVSYTVEGDEVKLGEVTDVQIALSVRELDQALSEAKAQTDKLAKEVSELQEYKTKYEASEAAEREAKHKQEVASLRELANKAGCFDETELSAMEELFENVKVLEVKAAIADKKMATEGVKVDVSSETAKVEQPKANLEVDTSDKVKTFRDYLKK